MDWGMILKEIAARLLVEVVPWAVPAVIAAAVYLVKRSKTTIDDRIIRWAVAEYVKLELKRKDDKNLKGAIGEDLWAQLKAKAATVFGISDEKMEQLRLDIAGAGERAIRSNDFFLPLD